MTAKWSRIALGLVLLAAALLYGWALGADGNWGNPYYAAAVRAMAQSPTNFVFGALDPQGVVTVDKPPLALWPQVISTWVFGYQPWAVLLPQVVEGVAAVFLLHRTVRHWMGEHAGLIAAAALALTPITVAIDRDNNPDTLLVLFLVAAAYAFTRALGAEHRTRWLVLAGVFIGCGFTTKMLQAWVVLPAFALAYLLGVRAVWWRKLLDLFGALVAVAVSSLWWVLLVQFWPGRKPFIGSSGTGSVWDLVIGYNGIGRVLGQSSPGGGKAAEFTSLMSIVLFGGVPGPLRLFNPLLGGQISWLLPLALLAVLAVAVVRGTASRAERAGWWLWGGWLLVGALVLSFSVGTFHAYYTTMLAPAIAALTGGGLVRFWQWYRRPSGVLWLVLPLAVALTAGWAWLLVARDPTWHGELRYLVGALGVVSVGWLVLGRFRLGGGRVAAVLGLVTVLLAPGVWCVATAIGPSQALMGASNPTAGPFVVPPYFVQQYGEQAVPSIRATLQGLSGNAATEVHLSNAETEVLDYAATHSRTPITLAVEGGAVTAGDYLVAADETVVVLGGFEGVDPAPDATGLAGWVRSGRVRFVLTSTATEPGKIDVRDLSTVFAALGGPTEAARIEWVHRNCVRVPWIVEQGRGLYDCDPDSR
ncbi:glycosyltransferase family 39 protein [Kutzneria viridogrisea]|uniref:4-amino-4-deoxy-L-arabinose transferase-like glycosyltransferase n=1 Tax=Kutzneria viridogrisea TaxID=47990 RepID=A0ABR6BLN7_9PSEU|nr:4-amino-4-deoxy-L-arabinose transferase-like glycosyltransferase [Kutzneria viridogrisea]